MAGWRGKNKNSQMGPYTCPYISSEEAARVVLRWVGFFGSVLDFFFLPTPQVVLLNAGVHISSLGVFL